MLRWIAIIALCCSTPSVDDVIDSMVSWATDSVCCDDEACDSGAPCQQCCHCTPLLHAVVSTTHDVSTPRFEAVSLLSMEPASSVGRLHQEPPFRPPVS